MVRAKNAIKSVYVNIGGKRVLLQSKGGSFNLAKKSTTKASITTRSSVEPLLGFNYAKKSTSRDKGTRKSSERTSKGYYRPGILALKEIRRYQRSTNLLTSRPAFQRLVREILVEQNAEQYRFQVASLSVLQVNLVLSNLYFLGCNIIDFLGNGWSLPSWLIRGHKSVRDSCQAGNHHAERHPIGHSTSSLKQRKYFLSFSILWVSCYEFVVLNGTITTIVNSCRFHH